MLWKPYSERMGGNGPWWNAPPERMREAYYMTLRHHYEMGAREALETVRRCETTLGIGRPGGFIGLIKEAIANTKEI